MTYFDELVWNNIISYVDPRPPKQDKFTIGNYSKMHWNRGFVRKIKVVGRTACFIKLEWFDDSYEKKCWVSFRKKIMVNNGVEEIKFGDGSSKVKITAHDKDAYKFRNMKDKLSYFKTYHSGPGEGSDDEE